MELKKITDNLSITCETYSNSRAWGHEVRAIWYGSELEKHRVRYYNRTWERYQFETALQGLLSKLDQEKHVPLYDRMELNKAITKA